MAGMASMAGMENGLPVIPAIPATTDDAVLPPVAGMAAIETGREFEGVALGRDDHSGHSGHAYTERDDDGERF